MRELVEEIARKIWNQFSRRHGGEFEDAKGAIAREDCEDLAQAILGLVEENNVSRSQPCGEASADAEVFAGLTVETAAVRIGDAVFTLPRPNRHHNVMWWLHVLGVSSGRMNDQGFVLSDGTYVTRKLAWLIAERAGQLAGRYHPSPGTLYSEDLWDGGANLPSVADIKALGAADTRLPDSLSTTQDEQNPTSGEVKA